ncbi:MAG: hypothetical protein R2695_16800 [Acidimicrobiales bacterium]
MFQLVSDFRDRDAEFAMFREMCAISRPLSFTIVESPMSDDFHRDLLGRIEQARADGLAITGQCPVRPIGILLGFECTLNPFMRNPVWAEVADLAPKARVAASTTRTVGRGSSRRPAGSTRRWWAAGSSRTSTPCSRWANGPTTNHRRTRPWCAGPRPQAATRPSSPSTCC